MDLRTSKGTKCLAISSDNRRCVTLDKSGLLTLWNIDVRYFVSEDPKPLFSVEKALEASLSSSSGKRTSQSTSEEMKDEEEDPVVTQAFQNHVSQLAFSPDGKILICVAGCHIKFLQIEENEKKIFPIALIRFAHQRSIDTLLVPQQISSSPFILTAAVSSSQKKKDRLSVGCMYTSGGCAVCFLSFFSMFFFERNRKGKKVRAIFLLLLRSSRLYMCMMSSLGQIDRNVKRPICE